MMKKDSLKKLGILGVSFGLMASPLAFAEMEGTTEQEPAPQEEPMQDEQGSFNTSDIGQEQDQDFDTEYEEEEEEFTYEEEEEEQDEWETEEQDDSEW